ncbi:hypothetical protein [Persicobacter psychrovividus]|uniref:Lipoprotein n=1 Tax=Persicobacter psychrovividus TaxID=387638 RepID=A0ABM7VDV4_9BACT|nr:hypothetical protein PEPS_12720 [Persicobacter psychrovividus]
MKKITFAIILGLASLMACGELDTPQFNSDQVTQILTGGGKKSWLPVQLKVNGEVSDVKACDYGEIFVLNEQYAEIDSLFNVQLTQPLGYWIRTKVSCPTQDEDTLLIPDGIWNINHRDDDQQFVTDINVVGIDSTMNTLYNLKSISPSRFEVNYTDQSDNNFDWTFVKSE